MTTLRRPFLARLVPATLVLATLGSCAVGGGKPPGGGPPRSGFLGDYSDLHPHPGKGDLLVYRKRPGALKPYRRFLVETPAILLNPDAQDAEVEPEELDMLAGAFRDAVVEALEKGGAYEIVDRPGPGVLRLHAAITDVEPVSPIRNIAPKAAGVAAGAGLLVPRLDLGRATIEVEMLDSQSDERLVAVVASKKGRRYFSMIRGAKRWGDVKAAFRSWAAMFRERLDDVHRGP